MSMSDLIQQSQASAIPVSLSLTADERKVVESALASYSAELLERHEQAISDSRRQNYENSYELSRDERNDLIRQSDRARALLLKVEAL